MKKLIAGILALLLITASGCEKDDDVTEPGSTYTSQGEWELVYEAEDNKHYHALYFTDVSNGWAVGDSGLILHTGDGGYSWEVRESGTESDLHCIHFSSKQRGWIAGSEGTLGITTDGGNTWAWQRPRDGSGGSFMDICFTDEFTGWLVNNFGKILHTEDGGVTWVSQDSGTGSAITSVYFIDAERGWATINERIVLRTENGGNSWNTAEANLSLPGGTLFTDVFFIDGMNGWITTTTAASSDSRVTYSPLLYTTDGGESWFVQASPPDKWLRRIRLADKDVGWLIGNESLFYTEDGGNSWILQLDSGGDPFVDICLVDNLYPWVLSYTGNIYKYTTNVEKNIAYSTESWEIGEHWQYSPQAVWGDTLVAGEYIFGNGLEGQYISTYNLQTREKQRIREIPVDYRFEEPSICEDKVVWSSCYYSQEFQMSQQKDFDTLNWDVFLINLKTGEVHQITTDVHAQRSARIYGDTIVWLDNRHEEDEEYPHYYDVYAYDLKTEQERRLTSTNSIMEQSLGISGDFVVWSDSRYASLSPDGDYRQHDNNEIYVYDLSRNQERRITTYPGTDCSPVIDNGRIVWRREWKATESDIFLHDIESGQETQISESGYAVHLYYPAIYGEYIVWADARLTHGNSSGDCFGLDEAAGVSESGSAEIYLHDLRTQQETLLVPSEGTEFTQRLAQKEIKSTRWQVWLNPVVHGDFVIYTLSRQIGSITYALSLR